MSTETNMLRLRQPSSRQREVPPWNGPFRMQYGKLTESSTKGC